MLFGQRNVGETMLLDKIIGTKGKTALFVHLFDGRKRSVHIRGLARRVGLSAPSLMREAKALVRIGLLLETHDGNRVEYRANDKSCLYGTLEELVRKTAGPETALEEAFRNSDASVVFIYGSRAKGTERVDSDYDVFVIGNEGLRKIAARIGKVADRIDAEINPYVVSPEEFRRRLGADDHFLREVLASPKRFLKGSESELAGLA